MEALGNCAVEPPLSIAQGLVPRPEVIQFNQPRVEVSGLTGLRFVAALSVAIAHGSLLILRFDRPQLLGVSWLSTVAGLGMTLFFVLSGFVIHYNYRIAVTQNGASGLLAFLWKRFARLYPLYLFILVLDILLGRKLFEYVSGNPTAISDTLHALPYYLTLTQSWRYVYFSQNSLIYAIGVDLPLTWSISAEWFFYLSYPLIAFAIIRVRHSAVAIAAAVLWSILWIALILALHGREGQIDAWAMATYGSLAGVQNFQDSYFRWLMYFSPYMRIGEFILGCIAGQLYILLEDRRPNRSECVWGGVFLLLGLLSVPMILYLMYSPNVTVPVIKKLSYCYGLAPSVAVIMFCAARYKTVLSDVLNSRPFVLLGDASYSIYLIHFLVFVLSSSFLGATMPATVPNVVYLFGKYIFLLAVILLLSMGLHAFLEAPARRFLRQLWQSRLRSRRRIAYALFVGPGVAAALFILVAGSRTTNAFDSVTEGIRVISATYGANCHAKQGNATSALSSVCNGKNDCDYVVDVMALGDAAPGCGKNFVVSYQCMPDRRALDRSLPGEAGLRSILHLACAKTE